MRRNAFLAMIAVSLLVGACGSDKSTEPEIPSPSTLSAVGTIPDSATVGTTLTEPIRVRVTDGEGRPMSGINVTWSVVSGGGSLSEASTATDAAGEAGVTWTLGTEPGENEARATVQGLDPVAFKVRGVAPEPEPEPGPEPVKEPATITLLSEGEAVDTLSFSAIGESLRLTAKVLDQHGNEIDAPSLEWSTSDTAVAVVDTTGLITARGEGTAQIAASSGVASDTVTVLVTRTPALIEISPDSLELLGEGDTLRLAAVVKDRNGEVLADASVAWNSEDAGVATVDTDGLVTAIREGTARITATSGEVSASVTISVMGKIAFRQNYNGIYIMNPDGTDRRHSGASGYSIAWSPDGSKFAYHQFNGPTAQIYVMNADGSRTPLTDNTARDERPAWSPDGSKIAFQSDRGDGKNRIYIMNADGSDPVLLMDSTYQGDGLPTWSPDGSKILFLNAQRLFVVNADGTGRTRFFTGNVSERNPSWSPDGSMIAFDRRGAGDAHRRIYVVPADGSGDPRPITDDTADAEHPTWSPDGSQIAFHSKRDTDSHLQIYVINVDGTGLTRITDGTQRSEGPVWRPRPKR